MGMSFEAKQIMDTFGRTADYRPVWSTDSVKHFADLTLKQAKAGLAELVEAGKLVAVKEDWTIEEASILHGVHGTRPNATYYMTPERLKELETERLRRLQQPYLREAQRRILDRHNDEVEAEFSRLWLKGSLKS